MKAQAEAVPLKVKRETSNHRPKWYNREIAQLIKDRNTAHKLYSRNKSHNNFKYFQTCKRTVKRAIRTSKRTLEISIAKEAKTDPKKFYQYANKKKTVKSNIGPLLDEKGTPIYSTIEICNTVY